MYNASYCNIMTVRIVLVVVCFNLGLAESVKVLNVAGFMPMTGTTWNGGKACLAGIELAFEHIHARPDMLPGYEINYMWEDTKVSSDFHILINQVFN